MSHWASLTEETPCDHAHDWDWFSNRRETARWDITFWQGPVVSALSCRACPTKGLIWAQAWEDLNYRDESFISSSKQARQSRAFEGNPSLALVNLTVMTKR